MLSLNLQESMASIYLEEQQMNQLKKSHKREHVQWNQTTNQKADKKFGSSDNLVLNKYVLQKEELALNIIQQQDKFPTISNTDLKINEQYKPSFNRSDSYKSEKYLPLKYNHSSSGKNSLFAFTQGNKSKSKPIINAALPPSHSNSQVNPQVQVQPRSQLDIVIQKCERELQDAKKRFAVTQALVANKEREVIKSLNELRSAAQSQSSVLSTYQMIHLNNCQMLKMKSKLLDSLNQQISKQTDYLRMLFVEKVRK